MNKSQTLKEAKKVLLTEIKSIKTLSRSINENFYNVVKTIFLTKGRIILTGIGSLFLFYWFTRKSINENNKY